MNREKFMSELKTALSGDNYKEAIAYYDEYFDEAGVENEEKTIAELGSPKNVAALIRAQETIKQMDGDNISAKRGWRSAWITVGLVFAAPIALPLAIAIAACAVALIVSLGAVVISLIATACALAIGGIAMCIMSFFTVNLGIQTVLFAMGVGLACIGIGIFICIPTVLLARTAFKKIAISISGIVVRRKNNNE